VVRTLVRSRPVVSGGDITPGAEESWGRYPSNRAPLADDRTVGERSACRCGTRPPGSYRTTSRWLDYVLTRRLGHQATAVRITNEWTDRPYSDHDGVLVRLEGEIP
jgi:hypothetical protein